MNLLVNDADALVTTAADERRSVVGLGGVARLWTIFDYAGVEYVRTLLPDYLQLAPLPGCPPGQHLMMYSFGTQTVGLRPLPWPTVTYCEGIVGVCGVELKDAASYRGPYSLMTAVSVSHPLPAVLGRLLGFPKRWSRIVSTDRTYAIARRDSRGLLAGDFAATAGSCRPPECPNFRLIEAVLGHPVISRAAWGPLIASRYRIEKREWTATPVRSAIYVQSNDLNGLPAGDYQWRGIDVTAHGGFLSEHRWRSDWPRRARA